MAVEHRHLTVVAVILMTSRPKSFGLLYHFLLFLCVAVIEEDVDVRDEVAEDGMGEFLGGKALYAVYEVLVSLLSCARDCLVCRIHHSLYLKGVVQGLERHHSLYGGAVGVCDYALVPVDVLRIDLGHHGGTSSFIIHALELSITTAPCPAKTGACSG